MKKNNNKIKTQHGSWCYESETKERSVFTNRWVFTQKEDNRYKVRLVVRGYAQNNNFDFEEIFNPIISANNHCTGCNK